MYTTISEFFFLTFVAQPCCRRFTSMEIAWRNFFKIKIKSVVNHTSFPSGVTFRQLEGGLKFMLGNFTKVTTIVYIKKSNVYIFYKKKRYQPILYEAT